MQSTHFPALALCALLGACAATGVPVEGTGAAPTGTPPPPPRLTTAPWTEAFDRPSVLIAEVIEITGPDRLAQQFVARQDPGLVDYAVETVSTGLQQTYTVVAGGGAAEAQLDAWRLVATKRMVVTQNPGRVDVLVRARGDVFFQPTDAPQPVRGPEFSLRGEVPWGE